MILILDRFVAWLALTSSNISTASNAPNEDRTSASWRGFPDRLDIHCRSASHPWSHTFIDNGSHLLPRFRILCKLRCVVQLLTRSYKCLGGSPPTLSPLRAWIPTQLLDANIYGTDLTLTRPSSFSSLEVSSTT
ncbi:hypothetical protein OF83DRAFT_397891 [Amylostereum chailletii]|nr:hypothetical protein OF83DRAFT_397891 [Amylostereum chailletii]